MTPKTKCVSCGCAPVSYTHLDVYKRQRLRGAWNLDIRRCFDESCVVERNGTRAILVLLPHSVSYHVSQRVCAKNLPLE